MSFHEEDLDQHHANRREETEMLKKLVLILFVVMFGLSTVLSGCSATSQTAATTAAATTAAATTAAATAAAETTAAAPSGKDLSQKVTIELMEQPWIGAALPPPEKDVYKQWIDKTFNVDFKLTNTGTFNDEVSVRFASGNPPDIIACNDKNLMWKLYEQQVIVQDFNKYLAQVPTIDKYMITDITRYALTSQGKLAMLPTSPHSQAWAFQIRKDWLNELGLSVPKTPDELLNTLKEFVKKDMYGKGQNNTYGLTTADMGGGPSRYNWGAFTLMFGPMDWYVTKEGKLSHPIVAGYQEDMLKWLKSCVDAGIVDPDWATQDWGGQGPKFQRGQVGCMWYPGSAIIFETSGAKELAPKSSDEMWGALPPVKGSELGGEYYYDNEICFRSISTQAEKDPVKLARILYFMDQVTYPNDNYWALRFGVGIDNVYKTVLENGVNYIAPDSPEAIGTTSHVGPVDDYGTWIACTDNRAEGSTKVPDKLMMAGMASDQIWKDAPKYDDINIMLKFDSVDSDNTNKLFAAFCVNYITGKNTDYAGFVKEWLSAGGQRMIDDGTKQLQSLGYIK